MSRSIFVLVGLLLATNIHAANRIAIKAVASEDYVKARALDKSKKVQTYQFMKGRFHPGNTMDPSMDKITFEEIVRDLAVQLQKQNYYPLPELGKSDLLIVVHWGRTMREESMEEMLGYTSLEDMGYTSEVANAGAGGAALTDSEMNATADFGFNMAASSNSGDGNQRSIYYKAQLLGMEEAFGEDTTPREELFLKTLLDQERYFVVLMAYDFQLLQQGKVDLLWTTRYSIRAIGQPFDQAIRDMNFMAGDYFGKNLKGLNQKRITDKDRVEMGEIEVIGQEPEGN